MGLFNFIFKRKSNKKPNTEVNIKAEKPIAAQNKASNLAENKNTDKKADVKKSTVGQKSNAKTKATVKENSDVILNKSGKPQAAKKKEVESEKRPIRNGKFEIKKSKDGRYVFNLYASNNFIIATSQVYSSSSSAMNGIKSVIANANAKIEDQTIKSAEVFPYPKWEIYLDKSNQYRFRLNASNGNTVCHSQGYTSKANCKNGIESIRKFAAGAEISKAYLEK